MANITDYNARVAPTWCPGCGNFGILAAVKKALLELKIEPHNATIIGGVGCGSKLAYWVKAYGFNSLHGRQIPVAQAVKIVNPELEVIATIGDGESVGEGTNHLVHAARRNVDIVCVISNNQIYGLTTGQASPTSDKGFVTISSPYGTIEQPINITALAIAAGASFVARSFAGDIEHLTDMIVKASKHKGFAVVEVLQPCVTFNKKNTFDWDKEHTYKIDKKYKPNNKTKAFELALENKKLALGVLYVEKRDVFEKSIHELKKAPIEQETKVVDVAKILEKDFA